MLIRCALFDRISYYYPIVNSIAKVAFLQAPSVMFSQDISLERSRSDVSFCFSSGSQSLPNLYSFPSVFPHVGFCAFSVVWTEETKSGTEEFWTLWSGHKVSERLMNVSAFKSRIPSIRNGSPRIGSAGVESTTKK